MPNNESFYWDACVFLALINGDDDRVSEVSTFMEEAEKGNITLVTSTLSTVEVAFAASERDGNLDEAVESKIVDLWRPGSVVSMVDVHPIVVERARRLIRQSISEGLPGLKAADAIHLATAAHEGVSELHTYDTGLFPLADLVEMPVKPPEMAQRRLGFF